MGAFGGSAEQNVDKNVDSKDCVHRVSDGNEDFLGNWTGSHSCYILAKNLSAFCLCPETLCEAV